MSELEKPVSANPRRIGPGVAVGVDEPMIAELVHAFYGKVRKDPLLGPIFNVAIEDWDAHLSKLCDFWSSVVLMSGRFKGSPMQVHVGLPTIGPEHFARWLEMFGETAREVCPPDAAALFVAKADQIGRSLQLGIAFARGELPPAAGAPGA